MVAWGAKVLALGALALLAGCMVVPPGSAPERMAVAGGKVVIAAPRGYCIDPKGSRDSSAGTFLLLGSCASLTGNAEAPRPALDAVLTAAVSAGSSGAGIKGSEARLARYFESRAGRAALSRSGRADTVTILGHHSDDGAFFLHLRDRSAFPGRPDTPESWRVLFDLNGHIVTLSVVALPNRAIVAARAEALLRAFMARVRAATPVAAARAASAAPVRRPG